MTTALVPLNLDLPIGGAPPIGVFGVLDYQPGPGRTREQMLAAIVGLAWDARQDGHLSVHFTLMRVFFALRGARGVDLETTLLLFLEREGLLS